MAFKESEYNPFSLKEKPIAAVRAEYTRLRDITRKRLQRLIAAGFDTKGFFAERLACLKKIRDITSDREIIYETVGLWRFVQSPTSTVRGKRLEMKRTLERLQEKAGLDFLNKDNLQYFLDFMDEIRDRYSELLAEIGSPVVIEYFERMMTKGKAVEELTGEFEVWYRNQGQENLQYKRL